MTTLFWILLLGGLLISTLVGSYVARKHRESGWLIFSVLLAIYITGANILVPRMANINIFGLPFVLVTGSIIWPFTAQLSDMINEIYGKKKTFISAALAYLANLTFVMFTLMALQTEPVDLASEEWFRMFFQTGWRALLASTCSYTAATFVDITIFSKIKAWAFKKEQTVGNILLYSGLRSAVSDGLNMVVDNLVFYLVAFWGVMPPEVLWPIIWSSMAAKVIFSQIDLPFYYLFRLMTKNVEREF